MTKKTCPLANFVFFFSFFNYTYISIKSQYCLNHLSPFSVKTSQVRNHARAVAKTEWILAGQWTIKLGIKTSGHNKLFQNVVSVLTQLRFGQWSSLPFCLPSLIVQWPVHTDVMSRRKPGERQQTARLPSGPRSRNQHGARWTCKSRCEKGKNICSCKGKIPFAGSTCSYCFDTSLEDIISCVQLYFYCDMTPGLPAETRFSTFSWILQCAIVQGWTERW